MSTIRDLEMLLRATAEAAAARAPLPPALRLHGGPLGTTVADRLERGEDLPTALAGLLPAATRDLLAGPRPGLAASALLVVEQLRQRRERRWALVELLTRPVISLVVVVAYVLLAAHHLDLQLAGPWLAGAALAASLLVGIAITAARPGTLAHLPLLGRWTRHADLANYYERAALVAQWKLDEAHLGPWLGADLAGLGPVLARPDAEQHCRRLATWHRATAARAHHRLGLALSLGLTIIAASLLLALAAPAIDGMLITVTSDG